MQMARTLCYRVVEIKCWPTLHTVRWEAYLLIWGRGKAVKGEVAMMSEIEADVLAKVAAAYMAVTGTQLPPEDAQLPLL